MRVCVWGGGRGETVRLIWCFFVFLFFLLQSRNWAVPDILVTHQDQWSSDLTTQHPR